MSRVACDGRRSGAHTRSAHSRSRTHSPPTCARRHIWCMGIGDAHVSRVPSTGAAASFLMGITYTRNADRASVYRELHNESLSNRAKRARSLRCAISLFYFTFSVLLLIGRFRRSPPRNPSRNRFSDREEESRRTSRRVFASGGTEGKQ